jgi:MYXO-CTERM domain-containing protein
MWSSSSSRRAIRAVAWFVATAALVYAALVVLAVALILANGDGLSCDAECGAVSDWLNDAFPLPMIAALALASLAGLWMARRRTRR